MERARKWLLSAIAIVLMLVYTYGLWAAAYKYFPLEPPQPSRMPPILSYFVSGLNGILAANLGALLGISASLKAWQKPIEPVQWVQWLAGIWYVIVLILVFIWWGKADFSEDTTRVVPVLMETGKQGVTILIAVLAAVLGVQTAITRARAGE